MVTIGRDRGREKCTGGIALEKKCRQEKHLEMKGKILPTKSQKQLFGSVLFI